MTLEQQLLETLEQHGISPDHPAMKRFLDRQDSFEGCVQRYADVHRLSREVALRTINGTLDSLMPAPTVTDAEQKALDRAEEIRAKHEAARQAKETATAEWSRMGQKYVGLKNMIVATEREVAITRAEINARRGALAYAIERPEIHPGFSAGASAWHIAGLDAAMPVIEKYLTEARAEFSTLVKTANAFAKEHGIDEREYLSAVLPTAAKE